MCFGFCTRVFRDTGGVGGKGFTFPSWATLLKLTRLGHCVKTEEFPLGLGFWLRRLGSGQPEACAAEKV